MQHFFTFGVKNKPLIIRLFKVLYGVIFVALLFALYANIRKHFLIELYNASLWSGRAALLVFVTVLIPGIFRRFGMSWQIRNIIMLFRRQLGILVFSFVFFHYANMSLFPMLTGQIVFEIIPATSFQIMGVLAFYLLTVMFFTSNDWSVRKLGRWWNRIHQIIYVVAWLIFLHVYLQGKESWSIIIGIAALFESLSLFYFYLLKPKKPSPPPPLQPLPPQL